MMPRRLVGYGAMAAAVVLAAACDVEKKPLAHLPLACETRACVCTETDIVVFTKVKTVPVEWRTTGEAYCPEGYVLRLAEEKK
jgi:hypothetical protein